MLKISVQFYSNDFSLYRAQNVGIDLRRR